MNFNMGLGKLKEIGKNSLRRFEDRWSTAKNHAIFTDSSYEFHTTQPGWLGIDAIQSLYVISYSDLLLSKKTSANVQQLHH